ncbi:MAG: response regulator transcription factor [Oscillospiraceae bacterium]|nr:response regulator transcription factor [Oscillospiraceae bacterium]
MGTKLIYILEDDGDISELESYALQNSGFETRVFANSAPFYQAMNREMPDLVLLDIMLPGESGLDVLKRLRAAPRTAELKIILVTAKSTEMDTVRGLDMGADDYITKPFGIMELVSRVKARLRTANATASELLTFGGIEMDESRRLVRVNGTPCDLTYKEYELLRLFLSNPDAALSRDLLMEKVWGYDYDGSTRTLDMHIKTLRKKLGNFSGTIQTVRNVGYKLTAREEP